MNRSVVCLVLLAACGSSSNQPSPPSRDEQSQSAGIAPGEACDHMAPAAQCAAPEHGWARCVRQLRAPYLWYCQQVTETSAGEACDVETLERTEVRECSSGLLCLQGVCSADVAKLGDECRSESYCSTGGFYCDGDCYNGSCSGHCVGPAHANEPCATNVQRGQYGRQSYSWYSDNCVDAGTFCGAKKTCRPQLQAGEYGCGRADYGDKACGPGTYCDRPTAQCLTKP